MNELGYFCELSHRSSWGWKELAEVDRTVSIISPVEMAIALCALIPAIAAHALLYFIYFSDAG